MTCRKRDAFTRPTVDQRLVVYGMIFPPKPRLGHLCIHGTDYMTIREPALSEAAFSEVVDLLLKRFGEDWIRNTSANKAFSIGAVSILNDADGLHLIGEPEVEHFSHDFNIWLDFPIDDLMVADDVAFSIFARFAEDIFLSTRILEDHGVRYRFITGNVLDGHLGSIHLTGTHAVEFVNMHRLKMVKGLHYNA